MLKRFFGQALIVSAATFMTDSGNKVNGVGLQSLDDATAG